MRKSFSLFILLNSGFFVLLRFYLRVDNTLIRVYDTRIYFEVENDFVLREYSEREETVDKLTVSRWGKHFIFEYKRRFWIFAGKFGLTITRL